MLKVPDVNLWLGNVSNLWDPRAVLDAGITALVDLAETEPLPQIPRDLIYCRFPLVDGADNPPAILRLAVRTTADLLRADIPTLVYCSSGVSRSPVIAAAALSVVQGRPPEECLQNLHPAKGFDVSPGLWETVVSAIKENKP
jgi:protein-tyrosine phosphatase